MALVPIVVVNIFWLLTNIIWVADFYSIRNALSFIFSLIIILISFVSIYPFMRLVFPVLVGSDKDFLPSSYKSVFFLFIIIYIIFLIIYSPIFISFFVVFTIFSGFASVVEFREGIKEKNFLRVIIPAVTIFGKLYFYYLFPSLIDPYMIVNYLLTMLDIIVWFLFLKDHLLFDRMRDLYRSAKEYNINRKFIKTRSAIAIIIIIFYLFSWPIYIEFWEYLIPDFIFMIFQEGPIKPAGQLGVILDWLTVIQLVAFIIGLICAIGYLIYLKENRIK